MKPCIMRDRAVLHNYVFEGLRQTVQYPVIVVGFSLVPKLHSPAFHRTVYKSPLLYML